MKIVIVASQGNLLFAGSSMLSGSEQLDHAGEDPVVDSRILDDGEIAELALSTGIAELADLTDDTEYTATRSGIFPTRIYDENADDEDETTFLNDSSRWVHDGLPRLDSLPDEEELDREWDGLLAKTG